jgi:hypothetical protein
MKRRKYRYLISNFFIVIGLDQSDFGLLSVPV